MSVSDYSFTHRERLQSASQFQRVFDQAKKSSSDVFIFLSRENTIGYARLGIVIAKRNVKRSVDRNLIRRIIKESFRLNKTQLPSSDYIVIVKRPIKTMQREKIRQQLIQFWKTTAVS